MQTVQRISAVLLCLVLVCLAASCGRPQPAEGGTTQQADVPSAQAQTSVAEETTAEAEESSSLPETTAAAASKKVVSLDPTQDDLEILRDILQGCAFFGDGYDSRSDNVLDYLYDGGLLFELLNFEDLGLLVEGENLLRNEANPTEGRYSGVDDPLGVFKNQCYVSVKADVLDDIMENTFCNTVYKTHTLYKDEDGNVGYYLYDGWYHFSWEISGYEGVFFEPDGFERTDDGHVLVTLNEYALDAGEDEENAELIVSQSVDAVLRETDGVCVWSIYGVKNKK